MKADEIRSLTPIEIEDRLKENFESMRNLRFQQALQQLDNPALITKTRKEIAKIKTILNEIKHNKKMRTINNVEV
ncbi:MAG: 50S ribosomal protein L29 [Candidatus Marinimicrobia bacterium]|nr:50S ribosomal protein L29 [Candidatus Neomarinimicrobiota bacterium]